jgi:hypothetical protein
MSSRAASILQELSSQALVNVGVVSASPDSDPRRIVTMHTLIQHFVLSKLDGRAVQGGFQRAVEFTRKFVPRAGKIRDSSKQDLIQIEWVVPHAMSLAARYTEFEDVLPSSEEWVALLVECAGCEVRKENWQEAKHFLGVANRALEKLDRGVSGSAESDLERRVVSMQSFIDEWGF